MGGVRAVANDAKAVVDAALRQIVAVRPLDKRLGARPRNPLEHVRRDADLHRAVVVDEGGQLLFAGRGWDGRLVAEDGAGQDL